MFFFKQKTAYEMRISDWSSDVCSSDLTVIAGALVTGIKSDLPGDVIATVTEPIYDTATGRHLLIPQGSRILPLQQPGQLRADPTPDGVAPADPAGHLIKPARQPRGHGPGRLRGPGGWCRLALGSHLRRRGADHAAGRRRRTGRPGESPGRGSRRHCRPRQGAGQREPDRPGDAPAQHEHPEDRTSVREGKRGAVHVDPGVRRTLKNKNT